MSSIFIRHWQENQGILIIIISYSSGLIKVFFKTFLKRTQCVLGIRFLIPLFLFCLLASSSEYKPKNEVIVFLVTCFRFTIGQEKTAFSSKDQKQA